MSVWVDAHAVRHRKLALLVSLYKKMLRVFGFQVQKRADRG